MREAYEHIFLEFWYKILLMYIVLICVDDGENLSGRRMQHPTLYPHTTNVYILIKSLELGHIWSRKTKNILIMYTNL